MKIYKDHIELTVEEYQQLDGDIEFETETEEEIVEKPAKEPAVEIVKAKKGRPKGSTNKTKTARVNNIRSNKTWTKTEDKIIKQTLHLPASVTNMYLANGRTIKAIQSRRWHLKKKGLL